MSSARTTTRQVPGLVRAADAGWWRQAVVYQIYPRSFADADGNGLGDLRGIISRIPYLAALGIDAVWLSPFYPSALADGGYDVDDYRDVDPRLGTLADFDELTTRLHAEKIKVIVDIVPNHTSSRHAWFREALAAPKGSPARNRYIFRDGLGPDGGRPPSDWASVFGGPAWTRVPDGQWYLHLFAAEQPDLNWDNREVRDEFARTLRFWSDRGADGFRVDVAHGLAKNLAEPLGPLPGLNHLDGTLPPGSHPLWDRDEVHEIYAEWRRVFNEYDPPRAAVAEAWVHPSRRPRYASPDGLGQAFNFDLLDANWNAGELLRVITDSLADAQRQGSSTTWVLSNHDVVRHATRYGLPPEDGRVGARNWLLTGGASPRLDRGLGLRRARAAILLMLALPGSAYLYQGEELGLHEVPAQRLAASASAPRVLITRSGVRPARAARPVPLSSHVNWPGACASVSMANRQPASAASASSRSGGSIRSGRQLISTATPASRHAANTAGASNSDSGLRPRPCRFGPIRRPVQWPSTSTCGLRTAATIRLVIGPAGIRSLEWTLATTTSSRLSRSSRWSSEPSSRMSTSMPVRMRNGASSEFSSSTSSSWARSRDADSPFATVSRGEWSVSAIHSCPRSRAVSAISRGGLPPSDQSECVWQSPRSAARSASSGGAPSGEAAGWAASSRAR